MVDPDSPAVLVARFLRSNNYHETLSVFLDEAGLPPDTGTAVKNVITIEQVLQEKKVFDVTRTFEKTGLEDIEKGWRLPESMNLDDNGTTAKTMIVSGADRSLHLLDSVSPYSVISKNFESSDSPILCTVVIGKRYLVTGSMSGKVALLDTTTGAKLSERRDHLKYVVKTTAYQDELGSWLATAAWDLKVCVYRMSTDPSGDHKLQTPLAETKLPTNPEALLFITHPEISSPVLLVGRKDSTFIYYYTIPNTAITAPLDHPVPLVYLGRQSLAPHSNAWIAFYPSAFAVSPRDSSIIAVATSAVPHMKLLIVQLLLPPPPRADGDSSMVGSAPLTQASQARAELAVQDREAAAILVHVSTFAPQTPYSTPSLAWRPDGSGIYVNGDDGVVRGIESTTGKVIATLKDGHEAGSKIRCIWAGFADADEKVEIVVSGGFDQRLIVWTATDA